MISIKRATTIIRQQTKKLGTERIDLEGAVGRVLAEDIIADTDLPPFDRSQMDGFAVRAVDIRHTPVTLRIVGESAAGRGWAGKLGRRETVRIMTGAPVPDGADTIVKIELTDHHGPAGGWSDSSEVTIRESAAKGTSIVRRGSEVRKGKRVISPGEIITPNNIAVAAAFGYSLIKVAKRPRVAIMATGTEIVELRRKPGRDQIRNSNSIMLKALAERCSCEAKILPITGDSISDLKFQISKAAKMAEILMITGGVSVGKYDLTKQALIEVGAEVYFDRVKLKPGKPTVFARIGKTLVFGLPGNPVSAAVTFQLFARYAAMLMQGAKIPGLFTRSAIIQKDVKAAKERDTLLPATTSSDNGQMLVTPVNWQGSSDLISFANADSLIYLRAGCTAKTGDVVEIRSI